MGLLKNLVPLVIALVLLFVCLFSGGRALGLIGPDEPRYAAVAREMVETGDWVTPRLQGSPWFEKPVLYYWAAALSFQAFGVSESAARLPSGIAAILAALGLAWLAFRITSRGAWEAAFLTFLLLPSCVAVIGFGRAATTDMLFSSMLALAMVCATEITWPKSRGVRLLGWRIAWGAFLGLAAMAKGPAAIVLAAGSVGIWVLATKKWPDAFRLMNPTSIVVFLIVALPWYVLCAMRNPDFVRTFLISHNVDRFLTPVFQHQQPFWFFGPVLLLGLVPWVVLLVFGATELADVWRLRRWKESRGFFLLCWALFPFLFFSISKSKLPGYILPCVFPFVVLAARGLAKAFEERGALAGRAVAAVGFTFVVLAVTAGFWLRKLPPEVLEKVGQSNQLSTWMVTVGASGIAIAALAIRRRVWAALLLSGVVTGGLVLGLLNAGAQLDVDLSARETAREIQRWKKDPRQVRVHLLHRAWLYGLNFYLHNSTEEWQEGNPRDTLIVVSDDGLLDLLGRGYEVRVARRMNKVAILVFAEKSTRLERPGPTS